MKEFRCRTSELSADEKAILENLIKIEGRPSKALRKMLQASEADIRVKQHEEEYHNKNTRPDH